MGLRARHGWFILYASLIAFACACLLRGWGSLYFGTEISDLTYCFHPYRVFLQRWLDRGVMPWWNPHIFGGMPVLEAQQHAIFQPISLALAFLAPPRLSLLLVMASQVALAGGCAWWAFRRGLGASSAAAAAGGIAWVFGGVFSTRVTAAHFTVVAASAVAPLGLVAAMRLAETLRAHGAETWRSTVAGLFRPDAARWWALAALTSTFTVLAGAPQYIVYLGWMQVVAAAACAGRSWRAMPAALGAIWIVAMAASAAQWLPTLTYLPFSGRAGQSHMVGMASRGELVNIALETLMPFPFGDDTTVPHMHRKNVWETALHPGIPALAAALALAGAVSFVHGSRRRRMGAALAVMGLGLYLIPGYYLPGFAGFRESTKARFVVALGLALAVVMAVDMLAACARRRRRGFLWGFSAASGALAVVCGVLAVVVRRAPAEWGGWFMDYFGQPLDISAGVAWFSMRENPEPVGLVFVAAARTAAACAVIAAAAGVLFVRRSRLAMPVLMVAALAAPVHSSWKLFVSRHDFDQVEIPAELRAAIEPAIAETIAAGRPPWRVAVHNFISNWCHMIEGFNEVSGYDPMMPHGANNRQALHGLGRALPDRDYMEVVVASLGKRFDWSLWNISAGDAPTALTAREVGPHASIATITRHVSAGSMPVDFYGPERDGISFVVPGEHAKKEVDDASLPDEFRAAVAAIAAGADDTTGPAAFTASDSATIRMDAQRTPNQYDFEFDAAAPSLFLFHMTFTPGWRARVDDGPWVRPWCANHWMPSVPVPAGKHRVSFRYRPEHLHFARAISAAGLVLLAGVFWRGRRGQRAPRR